jgi:hypothetical protein
MAIVATHSFFYETIDLLPVPSSLPCYTAGVAKDREGIAIVANQFEFGLSIMSFSFWILIDAHLVSIGSHR